MKQEESYLKSMVEGIVGYPEDIEIVRSVDEMGVLLTLKVNPNDMGVLIGREGNTVKAIRTLIRIVGMRSDPQLRINLKVVDPRSKEVDNAYHEAKSL